jgi:hypothetical protein
MGDVMRLPESNEPPTVVLRRLHRWRMALSGLVILAAGITIGAAGAVVFLRPTDREPPPDPEAVVPVMVGQFQGMLNLSQEQMAEIEVILKLRMGNLEKIRTEARPKIEAELQAMKNEIDRVLTQDQRDDWQRITERLDREFHRGMRRGPGRGGPGEGFRGGRRPMRGEDVNDMRRGGRFGAFDPNGLRRRDWPGDPNDLRRFQPWQGDPNALPRRGGRPGWPEGFNGERRPFDRRPDMNDQRPDPNMRNTPFGPPDMFLGFGGL